MRMYIIRLILQNNRVEEAFWNYYFDLYTLIEKNIMFIY